MRILVADDHPLYREAVRGRIERLFGEDVVVEASSLAELEALAREGDPFDLFLVDFHMPGMSLESLPRLVEAFPHVPVAVVSGTANTADIRAVIQAGARGFVPKTASGKHIAHAIELLLAGGTSVPAELLLDDPPAEPHAPPDPVTAVPAPSADWLARLTQRELEVLKGVSRGLSNKQIGRELDLAEVTVKLHLRGVFRKIGARTRSEAAVIATKAGIE